MSVELYKRLQSDMKAAGYYTGIVDGAWGKISRDAFMAARIAAIDPKRRDSLTPLLSDYAHRHAWGGKVSTAFLAKVVEIAKALRLPLGGPADGVDWLLSCMAFETGETFSPSIRNGAGAPYYGLIQFGEAAAKDVGTTTAALVKLTAEAQLEYVYKFFKPYTGKLQTLSDVYMRILWPAAVGKPESFVIFQEGTKAYLQNKGLDVNKDGKVTKAECAAKVSEKMVKGFDPVNM